jgi:hypothetical protein
VLALDTLEVLGGSLPGHSSGSLKPGQRFTARNCSRIGISCNRASLPSRSNHSGET